MPGTLVWYWDLPYLAVVMTQLRKRILRKCSYADQYKGLIEPKCGCAACWKIYLKNIRNGVIENPKAKSTQHSRRREIIENATSEA